MKLMENFRRILKVTAETIPLAFLTALAVVISPAGSFAYTKWITNGLPICTAAGNQYYPQIIVDGSGGAIITYEDNRGANSDIYTQRIDSSGRVRWTVDGVALCTAAGNQYGPQITTDGSGGAIITWYDYRGASSDIYAQRIDSSGTAKWNSNGVAICTAAGEQSYPQVTGDGSGGAIITWQDNRAGNLDIYAQRINALGTIQWAGNGVTICTAAGNQTYPQITVDGSGGAIITWNDYRAGDYDVYAQRIDNSGIVKWTANGVTISTAASDQNSPQIASDGSGGAIITWYDYRSGANSDIYVQKVDNSGTVQWDADGKAICTTIRDQLYPQITGDGSGGAIIAWHDYRSGTNYDIYAQNIDTSGTVKWTANGKAICTAAGNQYGPQLTGDGSGGAIITWEDDRAGGNYDIYAQRINTSGTVMWTANGLPVCTSAGTQWMFQIKSDGSGGAIITWEDYRSGGSNGDIYAQRTGDNPAITAVTPANGSTCGGTIVTVIGSAFSPAGTVRIGSTDYTGGTLIGNTAVYVTTLPTVQGMYDVTVIDPDGMSATLSNAYTFKNLAITGLCPSSGTTCGSTILTILGCGFASTATVRIGSTEYTGGTVISSTMICVTTVPSGAGIYDIMITNPDGTSTTLNNAFIFEMVITGLYPSSGIICGSTALTILGCGFVSGVTVRVGSVAVAGNVSVDGATVLVTAAAVPAATYDVIVSNPDGFSTTLTGAYTSVTPFHVDSISPQAWACGGGNRLLIQGTGFASGISLTIADQSARLLSVDSAKIMTAYVPAHPAEETVEAVVSIPGCYSQTLSGFWYRKPVVNSVDVRQPSDYLVGFHGIYFGIPDEATFNFEVEKWSDPHQSGSVLTPAISRWQDDGIDFSLAGSVRQGWAVIAVKDVDVLRYHVLLSASNLDDVVAYPNPFKPSRGDTAIVFANLSKNSTIRIYSLNGALVREKTGITQGYDQWNGQDDSGQSVASGMYYYVVTDDAGGKKTGKIGIVK